MAVVTDVLVFPPLSVSHEAGITGMYHIPNFGLISLDDKPLSSFYS
jgi:hypothetical protein